MEHIRLILAGIFVIVMFFRVLRHFKRVKIEEAITEEWQREPARIIMEYVDTLGAGSDMGSLLTEIAENLHILNKQFMKYGFMSVDVTENFLTLSENIVVRVMQNNGVEDKIHFNDTQTLAEVLTATLHEMNKFDNEELWTGETETTRILKIVQNLSEQINKIKTYNNAMHISFHDDNLS